MILLRFIAAVSLVWLTTNCDAFQSGRPAVAYSREGVFYITTADGKPLTAFRTDPPIGNFAISPDGETVIFTPLDHEAVGGDLYLLTVSSRSALRVSQGPYYYTAGRGTEGYSDPSFSPDGNEVVFAIHARRTGDAVETAGPFAKMNLQTRKVTILESTKKVDANGVGFANEPHWSPSGDKILLNFEASSALTDANGAILQDLYPKMSGGEWQHGLGWIGPSCIIYIAGSDARDADNRPARVLNLGTGRSASLGEVLATTPQNVTHLVSVSWPVRVRAEGKDLLVEDSSKRPWRIPNAEHRTSVNAISGSTAAQRPAFCE